MPVEIRSLCAADRAAWQELWTEYLAFYETRVDPAVYDTTFARLLGDDAQDFRYVIATIDGIPVGLAHYLYHRHNWKIENVCYLQDLYTAPSVRGQGVGRALIEAVYAAADDAACPSVYWLTQAGNTTARLLYDRVAQVSDFIKYQRAS